MKSVLKLTILSVLVLLSASQTLKIGNSTAGLYLTDANGMTLYMYTPDTPNTSTCVGACATTWTPLTVNNGVTPTGSDVSLTPLISSLTRTDNTAQMQVSYNKMPLYYYVNDKVTGDFKGQALGSKWYIVSPAGTTITAASVTQTPYVPVVVKPSAGSSLSISLLSYAAVIAFLALF